MPTSVKQGLLEGGRAATSQLLVASVLGVLADERSSARPPLPRSPLHPAAAVAAGLAAAAAAAAAAVAMMLAAADGSTCHNIAT